MNKFKKMLPVLFLLVFLTGCGAEEEVDTATRYTVEDTGVLKGFEGSYIHDTTEDEIIGNSGDEKFTVAEIEQDLGITTEIKAKDENEDGKADFGEKLQIEFIIRNNSEQNYDINSINMNANPLKFEEREIIEPISAYIREADDSVEVIEGDVEGKDYNLAPNSYISIMYSVTVLDLSDDKEAMEVLDSPRWYFKFGYEILSGDMPVTYFNAGEDQVLNYSGKEFE